MVRQIGGFSGQLLCVVALVVAAGCNDDGGSSIPIISGTPQTQAQVGSAYSFTPIVSDPGRAAIGFSIKNKPSWTSFNVATGQLSGTPNSSDMGTYPDILITARTGTASASLRSFMITVASGSTDPAASGSTDPGASGNADPLNLPLVQSSTPLLTFLGSFKAPSSFAFGGGAMSVSGTTMYLSALYYYNSGNSYVMGVGSFTIPTISGTPAIDGSNGTASTVGSVTPTTQVDDDGNPILNFGQAASDTSVQFTGSMVYNGKLYLTAGPYFDVSRSASAWIVQTDTSLNNSGWGVPNSSASTNGPGSCGAQPPNGSGTYTRYFAAPMGLVPSIWQPYLGGPAFVIGGNGAGYSLSAAYASTAGFGFSTFDPSTYNSSGGSIAVNQALQYCYQGLYQVPDSPQELSYRSFTPSLPLAGDNGLSLTLTAAPTNGATTATLTAPFSGVVSVVGEGGVNGGPFQITFSDGETRIVHLTNGYTGIPDSLYIGYTTFAPLAGCSPCTTAVTINGIGDNYLSTYDGGLGYGFIVPGSRSLLYISVHQYGVPSPRGSSPCDPNGNASGNDEAPLSPDTKAYRRLQITAYDLTDLYHAKLGIASDSNCPTQVGAIGVYATCPYAWWEFPNWQANWGNNAAIAPNCVNIAMGGFYFDPNTNILYGVFPSNGYGYGNMIVNEWSVTPL